MVDKAEQMNEELSKPRAKKAKRSAYPCCNPVYIFVGFMSLVCCGGIVVIILKFVNRGPVTFIH